MRFLIVTMTILTAGCSPELQTYDLSEEYATSLHYEGKTKGDDSGESSEEESLGGVPVKSFYGGDLKRGAIWWTGKGMTLEKGEVFVVEADSVGPDAIPFGATFPPLDFIKDAVTLQITARAESADGSSPVIYVQLDDANGVQGNAKRPSQTIEAGSEFKEYTFELKDVFIQATPKKQKVNGALINSLKFFINPGQSPFTGKIFIKEVKVIPSTSKS